MILLINKVHTGFPGTLAGAASVLLVMVLLSACSSVQVRYPDGRSEYQSRDAFAGYTEKVFRYHNRVLNDLIVATSLADLDSVEETDQLVAAEATMTSACQPLNEIVAATIEGREISFFTKLQLPEVVPACEIASRRVETLLPPI